MVLYSAGKIVWSAAPAGSYVQETLSNGIIPEADSGSVFDLDKNLSELIFLQVYQLSVEM
jgi:hypothetical protein